MSDHLKQARELPLPSREAMLHRAPSARRFWNDNRELLANAWAEWEQSEKENLPTLDESLLDASLRTSVTQSWSDPNKESLVESLWEEVIPNVFQCQFFQPDRIAELRSYLNQVWNANIPLRPPYGIVLNRGGAMLDSRSEGYLGAPGFQGFYRDLLDRYMRPIARLLFPEIMGYDNQTFGFSIRYQPTTDTSIRPHTDASSVTLNVNLNLPDEDFSGSAVTFFERSTGRAYDLVFKPGMAVIHRGNVAHAAQPIESGERTNFVLWLYGEHGRLPPQGVERVAIDARERWIVPTALSDKFAPF